MNIRSLVLTLSLFWLMPAHAADPFAHPATADALLASTLSRPAAALSRAQVLEGRFTHSKHLRELPQPLVANGEFTFARELGVYWHTLQPFDSVIVLTAAGITQSDEGAQTMHLSANEQPAVRVIADVFLALFTLDVARLNATFDLYGMSQGERWIIGLRPRSAAMSAAFKEATITGGKDVEQITLTDTHGDRTSIDLSGIEYSTEPPGPDVRALFGRPRS